jgi:hypothetical protein
MNGIAEAQASALPVNISRSERTVNYKFTQNLRTRGQLDELPTLQTCLLLAGFGARHLHQLAVPLAKIGKSFTSGRHFPADPAAQGLGGSVPKGVKLEIGRLTTVMFLKGVNPFIHQLDHHLPGCLGIRIIGRIRDSFPFSLFDLETADLTGRAHGLVVITRLEH